MFHHACEASSMPGKPLWLMSQKCNGDQNHLVWPQHDAGREACPIQEPRLRAMASRRAASTASDTEMAMPFAWLLAWISGKKMKPVVRSANPATTETIWERVDDTCSSSNTRPVEVYCRHCLGLTQFSVIPVTSCPHRPWTADILPQSLPASFRPASAPGCPSAGAGRRI